MDLLDQGAERPEGAAQCVRGDARDGLSASADGHDGPQPVRGAGPAHSDHDLVVFLEAAGIHDPDTTLDDPHWIEWRGSHAHEWNAK
ncbi:hypothetical protein ACIA74_44510 [Streptomyces sp. NPDC051658]|uniref:hypothetical protein n=1 Tax=Streptomyces sp. NPDC051658 TaxID=3365667 RepID=UPI0037B041D4